MPSRPPGLRLTGAPGHRVTTYRPAKAQDPPTRRVADSQAPPGHIGMVSSVLPSTVRTSKWSMASLPMDVPPWKTSGFVFSGTP